MSNKIKLPGWGHLDFGFEWREPRSWLLHAVLWLIILVAVVYKVAKYLILFGWARDLARLVRRERLHGPFGLPPEEDDGS